MVDLLPRTGAQFKGIDTKGDGFAPAKGEFTVLSVTPQPGIGG